MTNQTKTLRIDFITALKACGTDSLVETLYSLQDSGVIKSFDIEVLVHVDRGRAAAIENFFTDRDSSIVTKRKKNVD